MNAQSNHTIRNLLVLSIFALAVFLTGTAAAKDHPTRPFVPVRDWEEVDSEPVDRVHDYLVDTVYLNDGEIDPFQWDEHDTARQDQESDTAPFQGDEHDTDRQGRDGDAAPCICLPLT